MFFEARMDSYEGPSFGAVSGSKPKRWGFVLIAVLIIAAIVAGIMVHSKRQAKLREQEAAQAAERAWLLKAVERSAQLQGLLKDVNAQIDVIAASNSAPKRPGGKPVPQDKWAAWDAAQYRAALENKRNIENSLNTLADQYNERRSKYAGPWPGGNQPPPTLARVVR